MKNKMKYRKKPVEIEAIQWNGKNLFDVVTFYEGMSPDLSSDIALEKWEEYENIIREKGLSIFTLEGKMSALVGDYIIKGIKGEFYPCKEDIFLLTYDSV